MNRELLQLLENGCTVVTPTARLGRYLQYRYALVQLDAGRRGWQTPDCLHWAAWIQREWQDLARKTGQNLYLINKVQQNWLWQSILRESSYSDQMLQPAATARQVMAAHDLCIEYVIEVFPGGQYLNEDARAFRNWVSHYRESLEQRNLLDPAGVAGAYTETIRNQDLSGQTLVFYGFDAITPLQQQVMQTLEAANARVMMMQPLQRNETVGVCAADDVHEEIQKLAGWAQEILQQDPQATIGIICTQLQAQRQRFVDQLDALLMPELLLSPVAADDQPYNIALGQPLASAPMIHSALNILQLGQPRVPLAVISQLLLSPFIRGADSELSRRACFDARLRETGEPNLSLKTLFLIAEKRCRPYQQCPQFIDMLKAFDIAWLSLARKQGAAAWAQSFSNLLQQFNWPGERALTSGEFQTLEAWKDLLGYLASLEHVSGPLSYSQALTVLMRNAQETRFQPQTAEAPIQVMGIQGAAAMQFDYLWFTGCHDQAWPPARQPNPFIPAALQRDAGIAEAAAETHLLSHREMTRRLVDSAVHAVFSYPQREEDRPLRPSPLIDLFAEKTFPLAPRAPTDFIHEMQASGQLVPFLDERAPPVPARQAASGGSSIFRDQALCPFRAFARHRLYAQPLQSVDTGLSPMDRGTLVHEVLQNFWLHERDSASLVQENESQLAKRVDKAVNKALEKFRKQQPETLTENFVLLERQRLVALLDEWLQQERSRAPFHVKEVEQWHTVEFAGVKIQMRVDRIDALEDGRLVIVDYKTGNVKVEDWLEERPADPQLPLYAVTADGDVAAIVYGKLRRGECRYQGLAAESDLLPGVKPPDATDWQEQLTQWHGILSGLAREFREGEAAVAPRDENACRYCDLHGFCRIYERIAFAGEETAHE